MRSPSRPVWLFALCVFAFALSVEAETPDYVRQKLNEAKLVGGTSIAAQASSLVALAWPSEGERDSQVMAAAREELVHFSHHALPALRRALREVDPLYRADVTATFIAARQATPRGVPADFMPGLEEAIWYGSAEAQRVALKEMSRYSYPLAVLPSIDAAHMNPVIARQVIRSLGAMADKRARLFLADVLVEGDPYYKNLAAQSLTKLGEAAMIVLRSAARSDDPTTRDAAIAALLPVAGTADVTLLHEYISLYPDGNPDLVRAVREKAEELEARFAAQD